MTFSNGLSAAQLERLAILSEELGEAQQAIGKIIRHGYRSTNPLKVNSVTNKEGLEREIGDIRFAVELLSEMGDLDHYVIESWKGEKANSIGRYLHHQYTSERKAVPDGK